MTMTTDADAGAIAVRTAQFVRDQVVPLEDRLTDHGSADAPWLRELRARAKAAGVFAPTAGVAWGGLGLDMRAQAPVLEAAGYSLLGPLALNCAAPDEGNIHLLAVVGSHAQQERFLRPLAAGEVRSCFAMTEPAPGAGSDPSMLRTRAERTSAGWVIDGEKWYITGADGAAFAICMARTANGATMFLVDGDNPGMRVGEAIGSLDDTFAGGHCYVRFERCEVGDDAVLGAPDEGFRYAQVRLAPARLTHCMRWLGIAVRSLEIAARYATGRTSFGAPLATHQMVQQLIADSEIDIHVSRGIIASAAAALDAGASGKHESSIAKVFVSEAVNRVVDRAIQICGATGVSDQLPLQRFYREVRPFRIYDGASEVHRAAIARRVLRRVG